MVFHRIVPDFLIQTGAIRQSSSQAAVDSTYRQAVNADEAMERRQYEVHSRLRFNHRGQVAMALGVSDDDDPELQPQFFITLDEAPYLDGKHVLFGTITGPTMFNALRIGRTETDESTHQPVDLQDAPRIVSIKIVENPMFEDLTSQTHVPWKKTAAEPQKKKKKKRKGKKDFNVLSFGNELDDEDVDAGMKSSHDVIVSEVLSKQIDDEVKDAVVTQGATAKPPTAKHHKPDKEKATRQSPPARKVERDDVGEAAHAEKPATEPVKPKKKDSHPPQRQPEPAKVTKTSVASKGQSAMEARLAKYKRKMSSTDKKKREEDTMSKLLAFQGKVRKQVSDTRSQKDENGGPEDRSLAARMARKHQAEQEHSQAIAEAPTYHGQVLDNSDDENDQRKDSWLSTKFKCRKHMDHSSRDGDDLAADGRTADEYAVLDSKGDHEHRHRKRHEHHSSRRHGGGDHRRHRKKDR